VSNYLSRLKAVADDTQPALLFIPDISGFTRFVSDTNLRISKTLIAELLEILIDANLLNMELCEIQGDAILFYKLGPPPHIGEIVTQCKQMYLDFQNYLRIMERDKTSELGKVMKDSNLTLKIIVHYGRISITQIREFTKLMGMDVIAAHRLLKNDIQSQEYILLTDNYLFTQDPDEVARSFQWTDLAHGATRYDYLGSVSYNYAHFTPLRLLIAGLLPMEEETRCPNSIMENTVIEAPAHLVLRIITNFKLRPRWVPGLTSAEYDISKADRLSNSYKCMLGNTVVDIQTVQSLVREESVEYVERLGNFRWFPNSLVFYRMSESEKGTELTIEFCYSQVSKVNMLPILLSGGRMRDFLKQCLKGVKEISEEMNSCEL
jgi:hypothetical protein